jgi:hypothetical protein
MEQDLSLLDNSIIAHDIPHNGFPYIQSLVTGVRTSKCDFVEKRLEKTYFLLILPSYKYIMPLFSLSSHPILLLPPPPRPEPTFCLANESYRTPPYPKRIQSFTSGIDPFPCLKLPTC